MQIAMYTDARSNMFYLTLNYPIPYYNIIVVFLGGTEIVVGEVYSP